MVQAKDVSTWCDIAGRFVAETRALASRRAYVLCIMIKQHSLLIIIFFSFPLLLDVKALLQSASLVSGRQPRVVVIGGNGRAGSGAVEFAKNMGVQVTVWGRTETSRGGPFTELLEHGIMVFVLCVSFFFLFVDKGSSS